MFGKTGLALALLCVGVFMSGCASIVEGTDQPIRVSLSPRTATCTVTREGEQVASVSRDNQTIRVGKSKNDLDIECRAPGYLTENLSVESSASGWGVVGCIFIDLCITDYSTGALNKYPKEITIALTPETFASEADRDRWLEHRRASVETQWDKRIGDMSSQCEGASDADACKEEVAKMRKGKETALARLDRMKSETRISASGATSTGVAEIRGSAPQDAQGPARPRPHQRRRVRAQAQGDRIGDLTVRPTWSARGLSNEKGGVEKKLSLLHLKQRHHLIRFWMPASTYLVENSQLSWRRKPLPSDFPDIVTYGVPSTRRHIQVRFLRWHSSAKALPLNTTYTMSQ